MNKPNTEIERFKIIVIQSLKENDLKTGEVLFDNTLKWKSIIRNDVPTEYYEVSSKEEFFRQIDSINKALSPGDILTLQLETHGCEKGVAFSNDDILNWKDFHDTIRTLNETTGGLLVVCMAMCVGGATISTIDPEKRAPYRAIVAPFKEVPAGTIEEGFAEFYSEYNNIMDLPKAMQRIQATSIDPDGKPYFHVLTAEQIFDQTFDADRDPKNTRALAEQICFKQTGSTNPADVDIFEVQIRDLFAATKIATREHYLFGVGHQNKTAVFFDIFQEKALKM